MNLLLLFLLVGCAVKCEDSNYYVIQMPEASPRTPHLQVYWNVPTMQCNSKKIPFRSLERFGILQNKEDSFRGETIAIMYDPGIFPALFRNESGSLRYRNGGVPQEGDLELHIQAFKSVLEQSIPDSSFEGIGIIDFESWRPVLRQNFGEVLPYKSVSYEIERNNHWWWPQQWLRTEAKQRFEEAARKFMQTTVLIAKQMRPKAHWGYYGFPYCFNMRDSMKEDCAANVQEENDQIDWLWSESTALYPSVYSSKDLTSSQLSQLIRGRVREAARVRRLDTPILPYFWFRYRDGGFLSHEDLDAALKSFNQSQASGFIIWGSSNDVNTVDKCKQLLNYIENFMGPAIAKYTRPTKERDEVIHASSIDDNTKKATTENGPGSTAEETTGTSVIALDNSNITAEKPKDDYGFNDTRRTEIGTENVVLGKSSNDDGSTTTVKSVDSVGGNLISVNSTIKEIDEFLDNDDEKNKNDEKTTVLNKTNTNLLVDLILKTLLNNFSTGELSADVITEVTDTTETKIILDRDFNNNTRRYNIESVTHLDPNLSKHKKKLPPTFAEQSEVTVTEKYLETSTYLGSIKEDSKVTEGGITVRNNAYESSTYYITNVPPRLLKKGAYNDYYKDDDKEEETEDETNIHHYNNVKEENTTLVTDKYNADASTYSNTDLPPRLYDNSKKSNIKEDTIKVSEFERSTSISIDVPHGPNKHFSSKHTNRDQTEHDDTSSKNIKVEDRNEFTFIKTSTMDPEDYTFGPEVETDEETITLRDDEIKNLFYNQNTFFNPISFDNFTTQSDVTEIETEDDSEYSDAITEKLFIFNEHKHKDLLSQQVTTNSELKVTDSGLNSTDFVENIQSTEKVHTTEDSNIKTNNLSHRQENEESALTRLRITEDNRKGVPRSTNEDVIETDTLFLAETASSTDQVAGSADYYRPKSIFCILSLLLFFV